MGGPRQGPLIGQRSYYNSLYKAPGSACVEHFATKNRNMVGEIHVILIFLLALILPLSIRAALAVDPDECEKHALLIRRIGTTSSLESTTNWCSFNVGLSRVRAIS